ncbi:MAG TPA: hypothetical protein VIY86_14150, partial [Pirellulaceae bacterium]
MSRVLHDKNLTIVETMGSIHNSPPSTSYPQPLATGTARQVIDTTNCSGKYSLGQVRTTTIATIDNAS